MRCQYENLKLSTSIGHVPGGNGWKRPRGADFVLAEDSCCGGKAFGLFFPVNLFQALDSVVSFNLVTLGCFLIVGSFLDGRFLLICGVLAYNVCLSSRLVLQSTPLVH